MWGAADDEDDDDDRGNVPPLPGHKLHKCTDVLCLLIFLAMLGHCSTALNHAYQNGNIRRLFHGKNWKGEMCGFGGRPEFVYWCKNATGFVDMEHALCISDCPANNATTTDCVRTGSNGQVTTTQTRDYATRTFLWYYCLPVDDELMQSVIGVTLGGSFKDGLIRDVSQIQKGKYAVVAAVGFAVLMGFTYLFLLGHCADCLVRLTVLMLVVGPVGIGAYFIYVSRTGGSDGIEGTSDGVFDLSMGMGAIVAGLLAGVVAWCLHSGLSTAVGCIEASCECIFQNPSMLLEPFISLIVKAAIFFPIGQGFMLLLSCSEGQWTRTEELYILEYAFVVVWLLELTHAISQYALCFATQLWYFTPYDDKGRKLDVPKMGVFQGYCNALVFHLGSLALASFLFTLFRWVAFLMRLLTSAASEESSNPLMALLSKCCFRGLECYRSSLAFLNKSAYMDMAISSSSFCVASERSLEIILDEVPAVAVLNGAQFIFQVAGIGFIGLASGLVTIIMAESLDTFNNPESRSYIQDPKPVAIAAGLFGSLIALSFMLVFDMVGDTILYCFAVDQRRISHLEKASQKSTDGVGLFSWFFGEEEHETFSNASVFAPIRLRELIASQHDALMAQEAKASS